MRYAVAIPFLVFSLSVLAEEPNNYSYAFPSIRLKELAKLVLGDTVRNSYILDADFLLDETAVSIDVHDVGRNEAVRQLAALLREHGYQLGNQGKVVIVRKRKEPDPPKNAAFVYRPKFRSVSYLIELVSSIYGREAAIANQRVVNPPKEGAVASQVNPPRETASALIDRNTDVFVFSGAPEKVAAVEGLVKQLDVAAPQLMVKAIVYEVSNDDREASAVTILGRLLGGRIEVGLGPQPLANFLSLSVGGLEAIYSALATDSRFRVVSSPSLRVVDGEEAKLTVGSEVPVLGAIALGSSDRRDIQNVDYRSAGVILALKPQVFADVIRLRLEQQISSFVPTTTGVNNSPTLLKRELKTNIELKAGEIIVLGGLEEEKQSSDRNHLPFLPEFFASNGHQRTKTELVVVLQVTRI